MYIPDNYDMWKHYDGEKERWLKRRPICFECGEHIQEDYGFQFNGTWLCVKCLSVHRVEIGGEHESFNQRNTGTNY